MFEDVQETKNWFASELHIDTQEQILDVWGDGNVEELKKKVGEEREDDFREMIHIVREYQSNPDMEKDLIIREMIDEGFRKPIALTIYDAVEDSINARVDLMFMKRYLELDDYRRAAQAAVDLYLGTRGESDVFDEDGRLFEDLEADIDHADLVSRATRYMYSIIRDSVQELGGLARMREIAHEQAGYSEERLDAYFGPIEENITSLQHTFYYNKIDNIEDDISDIQESVKAIELAVMRGTD